MKRFRKSAIVLTLMACAAIGAFAVQRVAEASSVFGGGAVFAFFGLAGTASTESAEQPPRPSLIAPCVAGEKTWDGEGATNNWSEPANWTCDAVPLAADRVIFDATSTKNATIDINTAVDDIRLNSGYTGTVSTAPGGTFSFGRNLAFMTSSQSAGNFVCGAGSTVTFAKMTFTMTGGNFDCRNGSLILNVGTVNINGGIFDAPTGTTTLQGFSSGVGSSLNLNAGGTFNHNGGTIVSSGDSGSLTGLTQPLVVNNLIFNGQTSQNLADSVVRVLGNVTLNSGGQLTGAIRTNWELRGNLTVSNGAPSGSRSNNLITFAGSADQTFVNTGGLNPQATWRVNKPSGQLVLLSDLVDFGDLDLLNGKVNAGSFTIDLGGFNATGGNSNSYVIGKIRRQFRAFGAVELFPVGTATGYSPATANYSGNGATLTVEAKDGVHPAMNPPTSLGRFWTVSQTGNANADLTFTYQNADVNGNENLYKAVRINGGTSFLSAVNAASNRISVTNETSFGDFTAGIQPPSTPVSISPTTATLQSGSTQTFTASAGLAPYTFSIATNNSGGSINPSTGAYTAGATFGVTDTIRVTDSFGVTADATVSVVGAPSKLGFTAQPQSSAAGATLPTVTVAVQDSLGNTVPNAPKFVQLGLVASNGAVLAGTTTGTTVNGVVNFTNLRITTAGTYTITASTSGLTTATSDQFTISPGAATRLAFSVQPSNIVNGAVISPSVQVSILDAGGNVVLSATDQVTLAFANNPSAATLGGNLTINAVNGVATFANLTVDKTGAGFTLRAAATGFTDVVSNAFDVTDIVVTNTNDSGPGSLRQSLLDSNSFAGKQLIRFNIAGTAPYSIALQSSLPSLTDSVDIDATTQPGFASAPVVELNGAATGGGIGFTVSAANCLIRGFVINRFRQGTLGAGIVVDGGSGFIETNFIGTDASGTSALPNLDGIVVRSSVTGQPTWIGGFPALSRNVISGNAANGVRVFSAVSGLIIRGNRIGTDVNGSVAVPNFTGVGLLASNSFVTSNVISGNTTTGLRISGVGNEVAGNIVGRSAGNSADIPNRHGVIIDDGFTSNSNTIGGDISGMGNIIAGNTRAGIQIASTTSVSSAKNRLTKNSIFGNGGLGIKLTQGLLDSTPMPNDPSDPDAFSNERQNYPVITATLASANSTTVQGTLNSRPSQNYTLDFYSSAACDPSGYGEGEEYIGSATVSTDASGIVAFSAVLPVGVQPGRVVTATATDSNGNTSEFSACNGAVAARFSVSGVVQDEIGRPLSNVGIAVGNRMATSTSPDGTYLITDLPGGQQVTLTARRQGATPAPASIVIPSLNQNETNQNFVLTLPGQISGRVTSTINGAEFPLADALVTARNSSGTVLISRLTASDGTYDLANLQIPYSSQVSVTVSKAGMAFTTPTVSFTYLRVKQIVNFSGAASPAIDGRFVYSLGGQIGAMNADGSAPVEFGVVQTPFSNPAVSVDGSKIAVTRTICTNFAASRCTASVDAVTVMDPNGGNRVDVTTGAATTLSSPAFSPDGTKVAYIVTPRDSRNMAIREVDLATGFDRRVLSTYFPTDLAYVPGGSKLSFISGSDLSLQTVGTDGQNPATLIGGRIGKYAWSPDGTRVAYRVRAGAAAGTIRIADSNGNDQMSFFTGFFNDICWSPDGTMLAMTVSVSGGRDLQVVNADGTNSRTIKKSIDQARWAPAYGAPTNTGSPVTIAQGDGTVTFSGVTGAGTTSIVSIPPYSAGTVPTGFSLLGAAFEISTTATVTPPITVCLTYTGTISAGGFATLSILHNEGGVLVDRTISRDFATRRICAQTNSLSPFALAEAVDSGLPSITGVALDSNGEPMPDVTVTLTGTNERTTTTDIDGAFSFVNLTPNGNYNVSPKKTGVVFTEYNQDIAGLNGNRAVGFNGTAQTFSISGTVANGVGNPIDGVTVSLGGSSDDVATTDANGNYTFTGLPADGSFTVRAAKVGLTLTEPQTVEPLLGDTPGVDFAAFVPTAAGVSISGRVATATGQGIRSATVEISGGNLSVPRTVRTGSFGVFTFDDLEAGQTYVISVRSNRFVFAQPAHVVNVTDNVRDVDFVADEN